MGEGKRLNILLVEDDSVDVMTVMRAFKEVQFGNPIHHAEDGVIALEQLRAGAIDLHKLLILLDLNMPRMNGMEFLRELRADPALKHLPVVVLTTSNDDRDRVEAYDLNVAGYLIKPVTFEGFIKVISVLKTYWTFVELP
ncbi:MAG: response regulator [Longimicrobiales bacterium]